MKQKNTSFTKVGKPYLNLTLMDKTGEIRGRVWENAESLARTFRKDDFITLQATAVSYQNALQLNITTIRLVQPSEVDITDFLPQAQNETAHTLQQLQAIVKKITNPYLKQLVDLFLEDEQFVKRFTLAPGAKALHHVYLGGLLEHTLNVATLILQVGEHYQNLNLDLLLTGGLLHDIGKIDELTYSRSFDYSDSGRLIGHIVLGIEMINEKIRLISDFPQELALELKHLIISHHGEHEYGSPQKPKTVEALILYCLDNLDAKIEQIQSFIQLEGGDQTKCVGFHHLLDRHIYKSFPSWDQNNSE